MGLTTGLKNQIFSRRAALSAEGTIIKNDDFSSSSDQGAEIKQDTVDSNNLEFLQDADVRKHPDQVTQSASSGVQKIEAASIVWPKKMVYAVYAYIWVCFFVLALQEIINSNLMNYVYSDFAESALISTAGILSSTIGGPMKLIAGKFVNTVGRAEGLAVFLVIYVVGIIVLAASSGPGSYAAGYTLFFIGYDAIYLILDIFVADTSGLRNRAFTFAFASTPFICTAFTGSLAAQSFVETSGWRWGYGTFAIIMPFLFLPLMLVFKLYERKAEKMGLVTRERHGRNIFQSVVYHVHEFDVVGAVLLIAAFVLILLPFGLTKNGDDEYSSATFIAMIVVGFCLFPVFYLWERFGARTHFVRWQLFRDRTVVGACVLALITNLSFYCWDYYYYYFIQVVYDLPIKYTGYMTEIYTVGSCIWGPIFGIYVRLFNEFKYSSLFFALPLEMLGAGLLCHFRGQGGSLNYVIMCQIFIAFGGGQLVISQQMAAMSAVDHEGVAMVLALVSLFTSVGSSIGYAVAAAIMNNVMPRKLREELPDNLKSQYMKIYLLGGAKQMQEYPVGTAARDAINASYSEGQLWGGVAATCLLVVGIPAIAVWRHYNVAQLKQNKGSVI